MHPEITIQLARQRVLEMTAEAARRHARPSRPARPGVRARLGRRLVRWGHRLAPATPFTGASTIGRRPATMGP